METLQQRLYHGDSTAESLLWETLPWRPYCRDFTVETLPPRLYCRDLLCRQLEGCWGRRNQDFIGFFSANYLIGSVWGVFSVPVYHWLPLATIALVGDNRELKA